MLRKLILSIPPFSQAVNGRFADCCDPFDLEWGDFCRVFIRACGFYWGNPPSEYSTFGDCWWMAEWSIQYEKDCKAEGDRNGD